jgi:exodeoxyribonuclease-3
MDRLNEQAAELLALERPVVLAGDWNVVPEDRDVFSARATQHDAVMQPETRQRWRQLVNQGWTDALRSFHPRENKLYTFWDYTAGCWQRDMGFRLDHLLCSPEAADRLLDAGVDRWARGEEKASDHAPTWVVLS